MHKYDLGIIGGMGSEATVEVFNRIVKRTQHKNDQEHMRICILNNSIIPDRTKAILDNEENPIPYINNSIMDLDKIGVKYFIIPCNTAHYFVKDFIFSSATFISMIEETLILINNSYKNKNICILGTKGTINTKVYHNHPLATNLNFIYASESEKDIVMEVINGTKEDKDKVVLKDMLYSVIKSISDKTQNTLFVLACTELSLYLKDLQKDFLVIDAMDALVNSTIIKCGYKLKNS